MNVPFLIDSIVRQTTVLIGQLATSAGVRAPLTHIASETFLSLVRELEQQGLGQKVIADMFGMALRTYQERVQRLSESVTERGKTLWQAVFAYLQEQQQVSRRQVLERFRHDDEASVRAVLHDLVESGVVFRTGRGPAAVYRARSEDDDTGDAGHTGGELEAAVAITWIAVYRSAPVSRTELLAQLSLEEPLLEAALSELTSEGRITVEGDGDGARFTADRCLLARDDPAGWEAALFDHFQSVVATMGAKLRSLEDDAMNADEVGGSTYSFVVWPGHPFEARVRQLLATQRGQFGALWDDVEKHNGQHAVPEQAHTVTHYFGQYAKE